MKRVVLLVLLCLSAVVAIIWLFTYNGDARPPLTLLGGTCVVALLVICFHWSRPMPSNHVERYPLLSIMDSGNYALSWNVSGEMASVPPGHYVLFCYEKHGVIRHSMIAADDLRIRECERGEEPCVLIEKVEGPAYWLYGSPTWGIQKHVLLPPETLALRWKE